MGSIEELLGKTFSIESNWILVTAVSGCLSLLGALAYAVFRKCMSMLEPREAAVALKTLIASIPLEEWKSEILVLSYGPNEVLLTARNIRMDFSRGKCNSIQDTGRSTLLVDWMGLMEKDMVFREANRIFSEFQTNKISSMATKAPINSL